MLSVQNLFLRQGMNWYEEHEAFADTAYLIIVTYGKCVYWVDGHKTLAEKGDFLFVPPGAPFYGKSVPTVFHEQYVLQLKLTNQASAFERLAMFGKAAFTQAKAGCYELVLERLRGIWKEWRENVPCSDLRAAALALDALVLWSRELELGEKADISLQHAERMKSYIQEHYRSKITKEHLGEWIGRSPNHAATLFRRMTGQTISEYAHSVRMRTAAYLLTESLLTVTEIAEYLGYSDASYFQRIFKRTTGQSPSEYLKERPMQV
ncbi:AraC family transcriptional regulator [Paenibacillus nanensis]|uniref:AraC family transcriptional regulator n=1 Tax=Paenibacillus nanensis TaxID=393251 RepID=A0A3A1V1I0_9BACL|nr:AraC family transcriptional regulator [Paenibacillus nanensis]RIX53656.1 AraC family transcriptional regulator [Paenibacillus nanensis]